MAINVRVQHNGGFLPSIIMLTQCYYLRSIDATLARGKVLESWRRLYRPYWINSITLGYTQSYVDRRLETKVLDTCSRKD